MKLLAVLAFLIFPFLIPKGIIDPTFMALNIFWFIGSAILVIYIYITKDKEHKSNYKKEFEYEFPSDRYPEILGFMMIGDTRERFFIASVFELIRKNAIRIARTNDNKDYILIQNNNYRGNLSKGEFYILKWLFHYLGNDYEVPLSKITQDSKKNSGFFSYCYHEWANLVEVDAAGLNIFESKGSLFIDLLIYFIISYVLALYNFLLINNVILAIVVGIINTGILIYMNTFIKRTKETNLEYEKWKAFIRYVKKYDNNLHELNSSDLAKLCVYSKVLKLDKDFYKIYGRSRETNDNQLLVAINENVIKVLDKALSRGIKYSKIATNIFYSKNKGNSKIIRRRFNNDITFIYDKE